MVVAPARARRPGAGSAQIPEADEQELAECPFCEGREDRTPPETLALGRRDGEPDTPGWTVRVVPNLYPAFERQEVVVHSPRHVRTFAGLDDAEVDRVAEAWQTRRRDEPGGYLHALVNEGRAAGASLLHSHSQLVWLPDEPPAVTTERHDGCTLCEVAAQNIVRETEGVRVSCPHASRVPYELLVSPVGHEEEAFESDQLGHALRLIRDVIADVRGVEGPFPWNAWLHNGGHWHLEVFPRLTVLAGIELGAGIYVSTLAPEDAAGTLRAEEN